MKRGSTNLFVAEVAQLAGCHVSTVYRYEKRGLIRSSRDRNGWRRFSLEEAVRLREMLMWRSDEPMMEQYG
ncbi:MAG: MerR family transcriptional regulator [Deltaproteobacteria bacterium]|nr:MAG: MerR family transcriptional regulator [Deltaproteobacteria bacterium]